MPEKPNPKVHLLDNDARFAPVKCLQRVLEDIADGKLVPRRMVMVIEDEVNCEVTVRAAGAGMDYVPTSIGLLYQGMHDLAAMVRE